MTRVLYIAPSAADTTQRGNQNDTKHLPPAIRRVLGTAGWCFARTRRPARSRLKKYKPIFGVFFDREQTLPGGGGPSFAHGRGVTSDPPIASDAGREAVESTLHDQSSRKATAHAAQPNSGERPQRVLDCGGLLLWSGEKTSTSLPVHGSRTTGVRQRLTLGESNASYLCSNHARRLLPVRAQTKKHKIWGVSWVCCLLWVWYVQSDTIGVSPRGTHPPGG